MKKTTQEKPPRPSRAGEGAGPQPELSKPTLNSNRVTRANPDAAAAYRTASAAPIARRKLGDEVLDRLLARIGTGEFPPGSHLPSERELMELFGVGRPSVREALQALEGMGFISIVHGGGAHVLPLSAQTVIAQMSRPVMFMLSTSEDLLGYLKEARLLFEVAMARIAAERATKADIEMLRRALDEHRASLDEPARFLETDMAFHTAITAISHNPIYIAVSQAMLNWLRKFHVELVETPGAEQLTYSEHAKLFKLIAAHDADGAEAWLNMHIKRASKKYQRIIHSKGRKK